MKCAQGHTSYHYYAYYANTSDLFQLPQPVSASTSIETWYTMPAFKRRAFKTIQVEVGEHDLDIGYEFSKNCNASRLISTKKGNIASDSSSSRSSTDEKGILQAFLKRWVEKHFTFTDQTGRKLRPTISQFRETGAQITAFHQGEMMNDIMLSNSNSRRRKL
ncbi:hypothetical protein O9993_04815 [Vibrio lentus]|nr:hypothetical protein [Vibrio lentus]